MCLSLCLSLYSSHLLLGNGFQSGNKFDYAVTVPLKVNNNVVQFKKFISDKMYKLRAGLFADIRGRVRMYITSGGYSVVFDRIAVFNNIVPEQSRRTLKK